MQDLHYFAASNNVRSGEPKLTTVHFCVGPLPGVQVLVLHPRRERHDNRHAVRRGQHARVRLRGRRRRLRRAEDGLRTSRPTGWQFNIDSGHFSGRFCGQFWGRFLGHYSIHDITSYFGTDNLFKCHLWPLLVQLLGPPFVTFFGSKSLLNCHQFKHDLRHCLVPDSDAARALSPRGRIPVPAFDDEVYAKGCLKGLDFAR